MRAFTCLLVVLLLVNSANAETKPIKSKSVPALTPAELQAIQNKWRDSEKRNHNTAGWSNGTPAGIQAVNAFKGIKAEQRRIQGVENLEILRKQQAAEYRAESARQQRLADAYDTANAAAQGAADAQMRVIEYDALLRAAYPTTIVVRPYDPISDYWGIYVPGRY